MSKLDQISTFLAIIDENGFAAAARKKSLSRAAISRQIANLEAELGVQLLHRTTRKVSLTDIGRQYYEHCKNAITELNQAEAAITGSRKEATGTLKVVSSRYFAIHQLIPKLANFMALNPKLHIKLELAERFPDLAKESIDILFGVSMEGPPDLVRKRVANTRYIFCASPIYLKKYGTPKSLADLNKHNYITHSMRKSETFANPILSLNDSFAMRECAINGIGIVKLHDYIVAEALKHQRLVEILFHHHEPEVPVYLYYQQNRYLQPKIRRFIDFFSKDPL